MNLFSNLWDDISNALKARKGEFDGTSGNEAKIDKIASQGKSVNIANPTSYRTFHNVGKSAVDGRSALNEDDISIGLESGNDVTTDRVGEMSSTAIKNARYDPTDDSLNITYQGGDKEYKFQAGGIQGLREWINAPSKGRITQEWRETHRYPGF